MRVGQKYSIKQTLFWTKKKIYFFIAFDSAVVAIYYFFNFNWLIIPWEPISLVGIATAFYLGFKNNSSYERLWEARKIWGGIVNTSRTYSVSIRDLVNNEESKTPISEEDLNQIHKRIVHRHVAWLRAMTLELREERAWEHKTIADKKLRNALGIQTRDITFESIENYISSEEYQYLMKKGNKSSHILSLQSKDLASLKSAGYINSYEHMTLQGMVEEMYTLQGKSERIKNFPFPRQYTTANFYIVWIFILLLPFSILKIFDDLPHEHMI